MKVINYRGFEIVCRYVKCSDGKSHKVYYLADFLNFLRLKDAKDYIERNYLR